MSRVSNTTQVEVSATSGEKLHVCAFGGVHTKKNLATNHEGQISATSAVPKGLQASHHPTATHSEGAPAALWTN